MTTPKRIFIDDGAQAISALKSNPSGVVSIVGPTGSGKTKIALQLADELGRDRTLLVSVDSVALYRDLDIGSAKPLGTEREGYAWIGINVLSLDQVATSSSYVDLVLPQVSEAMAQGRSVILVGGSHFYERALVIGRMPGEASDVLFQQGLQDLPNDELYRRLLAMDSRFSQKIHVSDRYRITRYLDLCERQGLSFDQLQTPQDLRPWEQVYTIATSADEDLDQRTQVLRRRVREMFDAGWVDEVRALLESGAQPKAPGLLTIGYRDVVKHLCEGISLEDTLENVVISHRQLAKVQRTWVRGLRAKNL